MHIIQYTFEFCNGEIAVCFTHIPQDYVTCTTQSKAGEATLMDMCK